MRQRWIVVGLAMLLVPMLVSAQGLSASSLLPPASSFGTGWSRAEGGTELTEHAPAFSSASLGTYLGPQGARVRVVVYVVAPGPAAIRGAWDVATKDYGKYRYTFDTAYGREDELSQAAVLPGCAEMKRIDGTDNISTAIVNAVSLCAADPDVIVLAYTSGEVNGQAGYHAADDVIRTVLSERGAGTPVATPADT